MLQFRYPKSANIKLNIAHQIKMKQIIRDQQRLRNLGSTDLDNINPKSTTVVEYDNRLRIRFCNAHPVVPIKNGILNYFDMIDHQFLDIFLPSHREYKIVNTFEAADICIVGVNHINNEILRKNEINIFFTVENFNCGRTHYKYLNKFGRHRNPLISLYIYNDIIVPTDIVIPAVYQRIKYFNKLLDPSCNLYYDVVRQNYKNLNTPFDKKKFCLFISRNFLNPNKKTLFKNLNRIARVDTLEKYNRYIHNKSLYNSYELLHVFNQYKFIICFENSKTIGYITEKIFNVFLAKSIPIYDGDPHIDKFINPDAFLPFDKNIINKIKSIMNNKELYNSIIAQPKTKELDYTFINNNFDRLLEKSKISNYQ